MADETTSNPLTPYLCVHDAAAAIAFYQSAFGATESGARFTDQDGRIGHTELSIPGPAGTAEMYLSDEYPDYGAVSPKTLGGAGSAFHLQVTDAAAVTERAAAAGAEITEPPQERGYGERSAKLVDPFGYRWFLAEPAEALSKDELRERMGDEYDIT